MQVRGGVRSQNNKRDSHRHIGVLDEFGQSVLGSACAPEDTTALLW